MKEKITRMLLFLVVVQGMWVGIQRECWAEENYFMDAKWGSNGSGDGQFNNPTGVAVDTSGNVFVADSNNHRIQRFKAYPSGWLSGQVTKSADNTPISNAILKVINGEKIMVATTTDTSGNYKMFVPAGTYTISVTVLRYLLNNLWQSCLHL